MWLVAGEDFSHSRADGNPVPWNSLTTYDLRVTPFFSQCSPWLCGFIEMGKLFLSHA